MSDPFVGEIRTFAFNFAPTGWALCDGQLLSISQNTALFTLLGTTYGGNGTTTFALPNLQGRVVVGMGNGAGLSAYVMGQSGGTESTSGLIQHSHLVNATNTTATYEGPGAKVLGVPASPLYVKSPSPSNAVQMDPSMIGTAGSVESITNIQPFLALNLCIALYGIYPSRN